MWQQVQMLCPQAAPVEMLMEFEKVAINSFEHTWPDSMVKEYFFIGLKTHAQGAVSRIQAAYSENKELATRIRMIPSLAFAAPYDVYNLFAEVAAKLPTPEVDELTEYFEKTYIGRLLPGGSFQRPLFPIWIWNNHYDTIHGLLRSTNALEAWHRSFNASSRVKSCLAENPKGFFYIDTAGFLYYIERFVLSNRINNN